MLRLQNLNFGYTRKKFLSNLNLHIEKGQSLWIQGENGSGKTTLLKIIAGLIELPQSSQNPFLEMPSISQRAYFSPDLSIYLNLSTSENLDFFSKLHGTSAKKKEELRILFNLPDLENKRIRELSLGQKTRVALACFFLKEASLFLMDEPYTGLDEKNIGVLNQYLAKALEDQNISLIITSHQKPNLDLTQIYQL